jgi:hypothetical protein
MWEAVNKLYSDTYPSRFWLVKHSITGDVLKQAARPTDNGLRDRQFMSKASAEACARRMNKTATVESTITGE